MAKLGFVIDPLPTLKVEHDSSIGMIAASLTLQHEVFCFESKDVFIRDAAAYAHMQPIDAQSHGLRSS